MLGIPSAEQILAMEDAAAKHLSDLEHASAADAQSLVARIIDAAGKLEGQAQSDISADLGQVTASVNGLVAEMQEWRKLIAGGIKFGSQ